MECIDSFNCIQIIRNESMNNYKWNVMKSHMKQYPFSTMNITMNIEAFAGFHSVCSNPTACQCVSAESPMSQTDYNLDPSNSTVRQGYLNLNRRFHM